VAFLEAKSRRDGINNSVQKLSRVVVLTIPHLMSYDSTARVGIHGVGLIVQRELKWSFKEQPIDDWGIDALIEIVEGRPSGRLLALQIKAGASYFREENDLGFVYRGKRRHLSYWLGHGLPVVLVLYNPDTQQAFWQVVQKDLITETTQAWKLVVPKSHLLGRSSIPTLQALAKTKIALPSTHSSAPQNEGSDLDNTPKVLQYLESQIGILSELPPYFDKEFSFEGVRQRVRVSERRLTYRDFKTREAESITRSGFFIKEDMAGLGYFVRGPDMYSASDSSSILNWDDLRDRIHRGIILGDPGFGKTWLLKHEAVRLAKLASEELRRGSNTSDNVLLPIFMRLGELAGRLSVHDQDIPGIIADAVARTSTLSSGWIIEQIETGKTVLLLDALDEVDPHLRATLELALTQLSKTIKSKILLSSRIVGYRRPFDLSDTDSEREVEIVAFDADQVKGFVNAWFEERPERGKDLMHSLQKRASVGGLARIPILLSFICLLAKDNSQIPSQRVQLYESLLSLLLEGQWRDSPLREHNPDRIEAKLLLLEEIAWHFSGQTSDGGWHDLMPSDELARVILKSDQAAFLLSTAQHTFGILWELSERDGVLVKAGVSAGESWRQVPYLFIHRTFHEYLLASYLARLKADQWKSEVRKHLWYDVDWEEPIILLAARLPEWEPLLHLLADEENEIFHRMLLLAGRCLAEVGTVRDPRDALDIERALLKLLNSRSYSEKKQARRALVMIRNPSAERLLEDTYKTKPNLRSDIADDLIEFNPAQAFSIFQQGVTSEDKYIRRAAIANLGKLDNDEAKAIVSSALDDPDSEIRSAAAEAIGDFSDERVVKAFREAVFLSDRLSSRSVLISRIGDIGGTGAVTLLKEFLEYPDLFTRMNTIEALGRMRDEEAKKVLTAALGHRFIDVRIHALDELAKQGTSQSLEGLKEALTYNDLLSRMDEFTSGLKINLPATFGWVLKSLKADLTLRETYLQTDLYGGEYAFLFLSDALSHESAGIQWISAKLLCELLTIHLGGDLRHAVVRSPRDLSGKRALAKYAFAIGMNIRNSRKIFKKFAKYQFLSILLSAALDKTSVAETDIDLKLREFDESLRVPEHALRVLGRMNSAAAVELLIDNLKNPASDFRRKIVEALSRNNHEHSKAGLKLALDDPDLSICVQAVGALNGFDEKAKSVLRMAINEGDAGLRSSAVDALGKIGGKDAEVLIRLALRDENSNVRWHAGESAKALGIAGDELAIAVFEEELLQPKWPWTRNSLGAESLKEVGTREALYALMKGLHSHRAAYYNAARVLADVARGEFAVLVCDDVLQRWPNFFSDKREYAYDLLSDLAPEVRSVVGDSWPAWRKRIRMRIKPPPGFLMTLTIGVTVRVFYVATLPWRITRSFKKKIRGAMYT
jgi:HEAT repeat protein